MTQQTSPAPEYKVHTVRYGMLAVEPLDSGTMKGRSALLCEELGGRWNYRTRRYLMTAEQVRQLQAAH